MKSFKKFYYPVLALAVILSVVFSFVSANFTNAVKYLDNGFVDKATGHAEKLADLSEANERNALNSVHQSATSTASAAHFIKTELQKSEKIQTADVAAADDDGFDQAEIVLNESGAPVPTLVDRTSKPSSATVNRISGKDNKVAYIYGDRNTWVRNIAVYIPGTKSLSGKITEADVVLITTRYDAIGPEATSAAVVGAMIEHIKRLAESTPDFSNDFLFVFDGAGLEHSVGLFTFLYQFKGFEDICARIQFAASFDTRGNGGPLVVSPAGRASAAISDVSANVGVAQANSFVDFFLNDSVAALEKPAVSYTNIGGLRNQGARADNIENLSGDVVRAHAETMRNLIAWAGKADLAAVSASDVSDAVYFSYYNLFTVVYSVPVAAVLSVVLILLLAAAVALNFKLKAFNLTKALLGALIQVLALAAAVLVLYGVYFIVTMLLAGFGVIAFQSIVAFSYVNPGIIVSAAVVFAAVMAAFYIVLKKAFLIRAPDVVRGGVFVTALAGIILGFAVPAISYPFVMLALLQSAVLAISVLAKKVYKAKLGEDIERLFLYVCPMILCMPLFITAISLSLTLSSLLMLPVALVLFGLLASGILPYADYLKPGLDKLFKKLPARVMNYEEEVTEMVEDRAKKGKFTAVTRKKKTSEKIPWNYTNRFGIIAVSILAGVSMLLFSAFSGGYQARIVSNAPTLDNYYYNGAFNYVYYGYGGSGPRFEVSDLQAYNHIADAGVTMDWNGEKGVREKSVAQSLLTSLPSLNGDSNTKRLVYRAYSTRSRIKVTAQNTRNVTKFVFNYSRDASSDSFSEVTAYEFENSAGSDEIVFYLPFNYGNSVEVRYEGTGAVTFEVEEQCSEYNNIRENADIVKLLGNTRINQDIRFNLIFKYRETV